MPLGKAGLVPVKNMVLALSYISNTLYVITNEEIKQLFANNRRIKFSSFDSSLINSLSGPLLILYLQIYISLLIWNSRKRVKIWVFFFDSHTLFLPIIISKITGKTLLIALASSNRNTIKSKKNISLQLIVYSEYFSLRFADRILIYSSNLIVDWNLEKYRHKIRLYNEHFINFQKFYRKNEISSRDKIVAYIGRLSEEKGIINFIDSIPAILEYDRDIKIFIGGDGPLKETITSCIQALNFKNRVEFYGWIDHNDLPVFLNKIKLIVLPSFSEGLPNIILESMACGTPVLANPVGAISNIIKDGENGFTMEDNSNISIVRNIFRAMNFTDIDAISNNGQNYVRSEFNLINTIQKLEIAFSEL